MRGGVLPPGSATDADAATPKSAAKCQLMVTFGAIAQPLDEQLRQQGLWVNDEAEFDRIVLIAKAVSVVMIHGFMPHPMADKAWNKLAKRLWKIVRPAKATGGDQ